LVSTAGPGSRDAHRVKRSSPVRESHRRTRRPR
jgi:hypothetical protein